MYGQNQLNAHYILRYGLTKQFFDAFQSMTYKDVPVAFTLTRHFHKWIRGYVDANLHNGTCIRQLQTKYGLYTKADAQRALCGPVARKRNLFRLHSGKPGTLIMPVSFVDLALKQFSRNRVILIDYGQKGAEILRGKKLPQHFTVYRLHHAVERVKLSRKFRISVARKINRCLEAVSHHPVFGKRNFRTWLMQNNWAAIKMIHVLDALVRNHPRPVILYPYAITFPGSVLDLLARVNNFPFLLAPIVLISDRTLIPMRATSICAWGKHYQSWLEQRGIPASRIRVTGNFKYENLHEKVSVSRSRFLNQLGISPEHIIVTFTTQPFFNNNVIMEWIRHAVSLLPVTIVVKPHPYDKHDYSRYTGKKIVMASDSFNICDYMAHTDFVMTISSNTAIEAALFQKGIIVLQPEIPYDYEHNSHDFNAHLARAKAGPVASNRRELRAIMRKIVVREKYRQSVREQGRQFLNDTLWMEGSPSVRIRNLVYDLWNCKRGNAT